MFKYKNISEDGLSKQLFHISFKEIAKKLLLHTLKTKMELLELIMFAIEME